MVKLGFEPMSNSPTHSLSPIYSASQRPWNYYQIALERPLHGSARAEILEEKCPSAHTP